jgi:branched-chain amino acid transport system permease protein
MTIFLGGLVTGAIYAVIAIGYNVTLIAAGALNFAFPAIVVFGSFIAYTGLTEHHLNPVLVFAICALACGLIAAVEERVAIRLVSSSSHAILVTTVGAATILTGLIVVIWGSNPQQVTLSGASITFSVFGGLISPVDITMIVMALLSGVLLHLWTKRTRLGLASLAQTEDREAAVLKGVNVRGLSIAAFAASGVLAGLLGPVVGSEIGASSTSALTLAVKGFVALTIGGAGSQAGALFGGLFIGLVEAYTEFYVGGNAADIVVFGVFLLFVMIWPQGLLGVRRARVV